MKKENRNMQETRHEFILSRGGSITKIVLFLLILSFLPLVLAGEDDLVIPYNELYDIKRPCFNNGTFCSNSAACNFSLIRPDGDTLFSNQVMTFNSNFFNVTISKESNNQLGEHPAIMSCCQGLSCGADTFNVIITADGNPQQIFPTQFGVIFFGFLMIGFGTFFERLRLFKHTGAILLMVMGILTLYPGYSFINYSNLTGQSLGFVVIGLGFYFLIEDSFSRSDQDDRYVQDDEGVFE